MSLRLNLGTIPEGLYVKTHGIGDDLVFIGDHQMFVQEFLQLAFDTIISSDLRDPYDPRLRFIASIKEMTVVPGYNPERGGTRLFTEIDPLPVREYNNDPLIPLYEYQVSLLDLLVMTEYVLTNTDLRKNGDPRVVFVESLKSAQVVNDQNSHRQRISISVPLLFSEFNSDTIEEWLDDEREWIERI